MAAASTQTDLDKLDRAIAPGVLPTKYVDAPVLTNVWHTLSAEFKGNLIRVFLNGRVYIVLDDSHIVGPGAVGAWNKSDSVTAFDDFAYRAAP